jgi:hypothetical protein
MSEQAEKVTFNPMCKTEEEVMMWILEEGLVHVEGTASAKALRQEWMRGAWEKRSSVITGYHAGLLQSPHV